MSVQPYQVFFLQPSDPLQRRYEAVRAVLVEQRPMREVAADFETSYGTVRNWVSDFRQQWDTASLPPFSSHRIGVVRRNRYSKKTPPKWKSLTCAP